MPLALLLSTAISAGCGGSRDRAAGTPRAPGSNPPADAGVTLPVDAGFDDAGRPVDAGVPADAGAPREDGGAPPPVDAGGPGGAEGPCPAFFGFELGRTWTMVSTPAYEAQNSLQLTMTTEVVEVREVGDETRVTSTFTQTLSGSPGGQPYTATTNGVTVYVCDADGARLRETSSASQGTSGGTAFTTESMTTYDPPLLTAVHDPESRGQWSSASRQVTEGVSNGQPFDSAAQVQVTYTVLGRSPFTVPAGTFDALRIEADWGDFQQVAHYADGVGYLGDSQLVLQSYQ